MCRLYSGGTGAEEGAETRYNEANIQMLSLNLHRQLFPQQYRPLSRASKSAVSDDIKRLSREHLLHHKIPVSERRTPRPEVVLRLPHLLGHNIEQHFWSLGDMMGDPYFSLAEKFVSEAGEEVVGGGGGGGGGEGEGEVIGLDMKFMEGRWSTRAGWTMYSFGGDDLGPVPFPREDVMVLDVETCVDHGPWPLLAVAVTSQAIYGWVSPLLFSAEGKGEGEGEGDSAKDPSRHPRLIPLDNRRPTVVIGHNVSFDRARILGQYSLEVGPLRFLDTLSMHCAVAGLSSQQRGSWLSFKKDLFDTSQPIKYHDTDPTITSDNDSKWKEHSAMNNLADAVILHCGYVMDKAPREILIRGTLQDVRDQFQRLFTYCGGDVAATRALFLKLWPRFLSKNPHPVSFAALLEMSTCFLPVNDGWTEYIERAERMYQDSLQHIDALLQKLVVAVMEEGIKDEGWRSDPWLNKLDWTPVPARYTKARFKADGSYAKNGEPRPIGNVFLFGKPEWFRKIYHASTGEIEVTAKSRILPYLLRMKWEGKPVHFIEQHGWCYGVERHAESRQYEGRDASTSKRSAVISDPSFPDWDYYQIPHLETEGARVGSLMTKKHLKCLERGVLSTENPIVKEVLQSNTMFSFWTGYRERVKDQFVVWADEPGVRLGYTSGGRAGMIIPKMIAMGTVTRRAVEPTWMTATNSKKTMVGSELKSRIVAPDGYCFIGADVDSQELWISSLLGDAQFGFAGATALGWMTLQGAKADNTDLHSRTASILGMSRDDAKIFNYGRIYGAGAKYAAQLMQKFNATLSAEEATRKADELYRATKGRKLLYQGKDKVYVGGTETFMFNILERIARAETSMTPALGAAISDALISRHVDEEYLTSRVNWAVQSSGVDYLHMLVCSMAYLMRKYGIKGRLVLTIHDEVRYLVAEEDKYRAAIALQIANCWTRVMFSHRVGMRDLPLSVAFFSAVDFDHVLRKEAFTDCVTPSNPTPVPSGFALDIYQLLDRAPLGLGAVVDKELLALERRPCVRPFRILPCVNLSHGNGEFISFQSMGSKPPAAAPKCTKSSAPNRDASLRKDGPTKGRISPAIASGAGHVYAKTQLVEVSQTEAQFQGGWRGKVNACKDKNIII